MNKRVTTDFLIGVGLLAASPIAALLIQRIVTPAVVIPDKPAILMQLAHEPIANEQIAMGDVADPSDTHAARILRVQGADDDMPSTASVEVPEDVASTN